MIENYIAKLIELTIFRWNIIAIIFAFQKYMSDQISFSSNRNSIQKFKVVLVVDQNVGKSSIIARYIRNEFDPTKNVSPIIIEAYYRDRLHF